MKTLSETQRFSDTQGDTFIEKSDIKSWAVALTAGRVRLRILPPPIAGACDRLASVLTTLEWHIAIPTWVKVANSLTRLPKARLAKHGMFDIV